jgi:hypothetical protein
MVPAGDGGHEAGQSVAPEKVREFIDVEPDTC